MSSQHRLKWPLREELDDRENQAAAVRIRARVQERLFERTSFFKRAAFFLAQLDRLYLFRGRMARITTFALCAALSLSVYWALGFRSIGDGARASGPLLLQDGDTFHTLDATGAQQAQRATFADGSTIEVAQGGRLRSLASDERKLLTLLERGTAHFEVVPGGARQWTVEAGALSVEVVGTRFSVERDGQKVQVQVTRGIVLVRSPHISDGVKRLEAGGSLMVDRAAAAPSAQTTAKETEQTTDAPLSVSLEDLDEESEQEPGTTGATVGQLMQRADSARRLGKTSQAISVLETMLSKYPTDPRAQTARFQLARLYLAAGRFEEARASLALSARGTGPLSEDAYLRWIELERSQGAQGQAKVLAAEYLRRFPQGRHRSLMKSLQAP
jgi:transmembrane sensor